ncbi:MAG: DUF2782 domain-containing protein [Thiocapsa sp.]|uniref:DUF2782 domain-containing protein n=1 Tax=Thiocapsa sp. TaxID=2024551 RepID=UPI001BCDCD13|nr:DUF2782 domain-containing protein [Thiocapsa sp.]QVL50864.1 MAG: DUF2782 domain-containing protein [Thiocapsa sp.]
MTRTILLTIPLLLCLGTAYAQEEQPSAAGGGFLEAPTVIPSPITGEAVEPEITIIESGDDVIYEYRIRGVLYMVRIQPQFGPPYFLFDTNGDGILDMQENAANNISIPQWVLFEWN